MHLYRLSDVTMHSAFTLTHTCTYANIYTHLHKQNTERKVDGSSNDYNDDDLLES